MTTPPAPPRPTAAAARPGVAPRAGTDARTPLVPRTPVSAASPLTPRTPLAPRTPVAPRTSAAGRTPLAGASAPRTPLVPRKPAAAGASAPRTPLVPRTTTAPSAPAVRATTVAAAKSGSLSPAAFDYVRDLVYREAAIVLEPGKEYLVEARLLPLARQDGKDGVSAFVDGVRASRNPRDTARIVDALTTNETSWFRDSSPFRALEQHLVPEILASGRPDRTLKIWSAACSSGQEPYTVAMSIQDKVKAAGWRLDILATDISEEMLVRARTGRYSQLEVNRGLPAPLLVKHFTRKGTEWEAGPELRSSIRFQRMNLAAAFAPMQPFDIVLLRNVLIYFDTATKRGILQRVAGVMRPEASLLLGGAETTLGVDDSWERVLIAGAPVHKLGARLGRRGA